MKSKKDSKVQKRKVRSQKNNAYEKSEIKIIKYYKKNIKKFKKMLKYLLKKLFQIKIIETFTKKLFQYYKYAFFQTFLCKIETISFRIDNKILKF